MADPNKPTPGKSYFSRGDANNGVAACQDALNLARPWVAGLANLPPLSLNGIFDQATHDMAVAFQRGVGMTGSDIDGKIGKKTCNLLFSKVSSTDLFEINFPKPLPTPAPGLMPPFTLPSLLNPLAAVNTADLLGRKTQALFWMDRARTVGDVLRFPASGLLDNGLHPLVFSQLANAETFNLRGGAKHVLELIQLKPINYTFSAGGQRTFKFSTAIPTRIVPAYARMLGTEVFQQTVGDVDIGYQSAFRRESDIHLTDIFTLQGFAELKLGMAARFGNGVGTLDASANAGLGASLTADLHKSPLGVPLEVHAKIVGSAGGNTSVRADILNGQISGSLNVYYGATAIVGANFSF